METNEHIPPGGAESHRHANEPAGRHSEFPSEWNHVPGPSPSLIAALSAVSAIALLGAALYISGVLARPSLSDTDWVEAPAAVRDFELPKTFLWVGPDFGEGVAEPAATTAAR